MYTTWRNETLNDYSGNAGDVEVNGDGWVEVWVPPEGWVFYARTDFPPQSAIFSVALESRAVSTASNLIYHDEVY
ncbi:DUF1939 domain-containing protein [Natronosalvus rutilus]|uniref:DUF1939 domain-containing protein n=1 Tax=Natronosalvus rutilus TaxID=2953753 RepID=A0A9E7NB73_9EURY|nr:DUF1939 domain-containing protein [Natronosalvus rutilus]